MVAAPCGDAWRGVWCGGDVPCGCVRQEQDWRLKAVFVTAFPQDWDERTKRKNMVKTMDADYVPPVIEPILDERVSTVESSSLRSYEEAAYPRGIEDA